LQLPYAPENLGEDDDFLQVSSARRLVNISAEPPGARLCVFSAVPRHGEKDLPDLEQSLQQHHHYSGGSNWN
jgi:hypothetical protein